MQRCWVKLRYPLLFLLGPEALPGGVLPPGATTKAPARLGQAVRYHVAIPAFTRLKSQQSEPTQDLPREQCPGNASGMGEYTMTIMRDGAGLLLEGTRLG